ncbi:MAG TPA: 2-C-methyl-D-erythritol 4-phosphate cytidylyltransferase [Actinomycetota bacterium]|jgi:2-C-methyl-D-erythritol 4-phosphate cytidylyltransferase/2-C-methyl-D-erythritol 2,4-cyclodiphosphate synthase
MTGNAVAILLAAGSGSRVGGDRPKAFLTAGGRSILTMAAQSACQADRIASIVVTVPPGWERRAISLLPSGAVSVVVSGGASRQESVRLALGSVPASSPVVVVHDAARALATPALFDAVVGALDGVARDAGVIAGAIPVIPVPDTVKRVRDGRIAETIARDGLVLAQTPQAFLRETLVEAHERAAGEGLEFTDDAAIVEWAGSRVMTVPGDPGNFKVTTREDFDRLWAAAEQEEPW